MTRRVLPLVVAVAFAAGAVNAYRLPPRTMWGDVYSHVPNHLVTAGMALLVAAGLAALGRLGTTARARRAGARAAGAWALLSAVFVLDAVGGAIGDRTGDFTVHDAAMVLLLAAGPLLGLATLLLVLARGSWAPWRLRFAALASAPGTLALNEASSGPWLAVGLVAAAAWFLVAQHAAGRPAPATAADADVRTPARA